MTLKNPHVASVHALKHKEKYMLRNISITFLPPLFLDLCRRGRSGSLDALEGPGSLPALEGPVALPGLDCRLSRAKRSISATRSNPAALRATFSACSRSACSRLNRSCISRFCLSNFSCRTLSNSSLFRLSIAAMRSDSSFRSCCNFILSFFEGTATKSQ